MARLWSCLLIAAAFVIIAGSIPQSFAHPITVDSSPKPFASLPSAPGQVVVTFSEAIELDYSRITVLGPDGGRVDLNDPYNAEGDTATLAVTLQPSLPEGVYTVITKVLSAVDGHVVESAYIFGIGVAPPGTGPESVPVDILAPDQSAARFPGMVGQVMAVGAAFGTLWLWKPIERVPRLASAISAQRLAIDRRMLLLVITGTALVLASGVAIIVIQAVSINAGIAEAIATKFGNVWVIRMVESSILMIISVFVYRKMVKSSALPSRAEVLSILVMGLAVLVTSSLTAHGAATEQLPAIILDFIHNSAASVWIGGLVLMGFVAVPKLLAVSDERVRSAAISILIPRFSTVVVAILGLVVITGPLLLFTLESDLSLTLASTYGRILLAKLSLAGVMVAMGAYSQFVVQKRAVVAMAGGSASVPAGTGRFAKSLKAEAAVGLALIMLVSLMANGALPAGEFPQYRRAQEPQEASAAPTSAQYVQVLYTEAGRVDLAIEPFAVGQNRFSLSFFDRDGNPAADVSPATVKLTQLEKGIGPISIDMERKGDGVFSADAAFSLAGRWSIEVEGVRPQSTNIVASLDVTVRPAISNLSFEVKEYRTPEPSLPLFPVFDAGRQSVWTGDTLPNTGRIWQLDIDSGSYTKHELAGINLVTQVVLDPSGRLWYIDPVQTVIGLYEPETKENRVFELPVQGVISGVAIDGRGSLWMPVVQPNKIVKFEPASETFSTFDIPTADARPVGIATDRSGNVWLAESAGKIARIDAATGDIEEFEPPGQNKLVVPAAVFPDPASDDIFVAEHDGHTVSVFSPLFETFREYPAVNPGGLPFGMAQDSFGNLWYAQHEVDRVAVIDPQTGAGTEVKIPIAGSFIQWLASDDGGRIWFAAQRGAALGSITITAKPPSPEPPAPPTEPPAEQVPDIGFSFKDAAGPGIAAGIVISALFYAKSASDLKRNVRAASKLDL
jgi:copper transport protein